jgi:hypothetical protein
MSPKRRKRGKRGRRYQGTPLMVMVSGCNVLHQGYDAVDDTFFA